MHNTKRKKSDSPVNHNSVAKRCRRSSSPKPVYHLEKSTAPASSSRRALRKSLSATACLPDKDLAGIYSDSDSDLPDAQSLLKTLAEQKQTPQSQQLSDKLDATSVLVSQDQDRAKPKIVKAVSEVINTNSDERIEDMTDLKPIKVPGELVLAYALRKYYPARVELQVSPQKYVVRFFDGSKSLLSKKRILTIYDNSFYTCPLGAIQLIGDEPAKQANKRMRGSREEKVNPNNDFEWDKKAFANLIKEAEAIKHHLDALHSCTSDEVCSFDDVEDRMSIFFGNDKSRKQMLTSRVSKGFLNRAEFDFLGRLLNSWYELSPTAARGEARSSGVVAASTDEDANKSKQEYNCSNSQPLQQINSSRDIIEIPGLATNFVHEVLLPHAIKRMTAEREKCSLSEAEIRMAHEDSDTQWVDYILAARVSGMVQQCLKLQ